MPDQTSNTYYDWLLDRAFLAVPTQVIVGQFISTFKEFPPRQKAASFNVLGIMDKLNQTTGD
jgi:arylsulfatase